MLQQEITNSLRAHSLCLRMNLIKNRFLLKNLAYLGCCSLAECWGGGVGQPLPCCSTRTCGSVSINCASSVSDLSGFCASSKPVLFPCSATSVLRCRSTEASFLPFHLHVQRCRLYCNTRFLCLVDRGKKGGKEREVSPSMDTSVLFLLS